MKIGVVGFGFVGKATFNAFDKKVQDAEQYVYDPYMDHNAILDWTVTHSCKEPTICSSLADLKPCDVVFICVPTPTDFVKGQQDTSIVEGAVNDLCQACRGKRMPGLPEIVIKSTLKPGTTQKLQDQNPEFGIIFNPEFLVEKTYLDDALNQDRIVVGGKDPGPLLDVYGYGWPAARFYPMSATEAELVKYAANAFLATKVAFWNEIYFLAQALGAGYTTIANAATSDQRIGTWGSQVPGPDGQYGFGGKCFPKDLVTLLRLGSDLCVPNFVQRGTWRTNEAVREVQDWHDITGATTEKAYGGEDLDQ